MASLAAVVFALSPAAWAALLLVAALAYALWRIRAPYLPDLPTPPRWPWFGHVLEFNKAVGQLYEINSFYHNQWRRPFYVALPGVQPIIQLVTPEQHEWFFKTNFDNYVKGELVNDFFGEVAGAGIFNSDGEQWRHQRKIASHMFSMRVLRDDMFPIFVEHSRKATELLAALPQGQPTDLQNLFFRFTMDAICHIAFGVQLKTLSHPHPFSVSFDFAQSVVKLRAMTPRPVWRLKKLLDIGDERRMREAVAEMDAFAHQIILERQALGASELRAFPDLLSRFIEEARQRGEEPAPRFLRDQVMNYILAGRDTTACALTWAFFELGRHPEWQDKLVAELRAVCRGPEPTYDEVRQLQLLEAFVYEVLRLHPSVPVDGKLALNDDVLPGGVRVPRGALVIFCPFAMGRDPSLWREPLEFRPERFLAAPAGGPSPFAYPVFNAGPRLCLGKHVALLEIKTLMATLLSHLCVHVLPTDDRYAMTIVLPKLTPLLASFSPRTAV